MFWSGETLTGRGKQLVAPFNPDRVDCAAYKLSVGSEVYVSPDDQAPDRTTVTVRQLDQGETFTIPPSQLDQGGAFAIPPGQFAFLITEEIVTVPNDAIAFISIRAKIKFRGLVNVSGFHVDPGFHGQLTFSVFNAGPVSVHLKRGEPIFLIWYASLDQESTFRKDDSIKRGIDTKLITGIAGGLQSLAGLSKKIENVEKKLTERVHAVEKCQTSLNASMDTLKKIAIGVAVGVALSLIASWLLKTGWKI